MLWPDAYMRGGGHCNQLEQLLGRIQCASWVESPRRTMVVSELRSDRPVSMRHSFESVYDIASLRTAFNVATWSEFSAECGNRASLVSEDCSVDGDAAFARHAPGYVGSIEWSSSCDGTLPRCAVGVSYDPFVALSCPRDKTSRKRLFKSGRTCRGESSPTCKVGFDWSSSLNASSNFIGIVDESRRKTHLEACNARALSRLEAEAGSRGSVGLEAFRPAPKLREVLVELKRALGLVDGQYDAMHLRLGDFAKLCGQRDSDGRAAKFCPPNPTLLPKAVDNLPSPSFPILLLSDESEKALGFLRRDDHRRRFVSIQQHRNFSSAILDTYGPLATLVLEIELALNSRTFVGVACSTVSQWIIKRRDAASTHPQTKKPFLLWP